MTVRHRTHKSPDAPPSAPTLKAPADFSLKSNEGEVAALKAQIVKLKELLRFHTGMSVDERR